MRGTRRSPCGSNGHLHLTFHFLRKVSQDYRKRRRSASEIEYRATFHRVSRVPMLCRELLQPPGVHCIPAFVRSEACNKAASCEQDGHGSSAERLASEGHFEKIRWPSRRPCPTKPSHQGQPPVAPCYKGVDHTS